MAGTLRFVHNPQGIGELLRSPGLRDHLRVRAERVGAAARAETDMEILVEDRTGSRARCRIVANDIRAKLVESRTRLLGRAMDAAR